MTSSLNIEALFKSE